MKISIREKLDKATGVLVSKTSNESVRLCLILAKAAEAQSTQLLILNLWLVLG